MSVKPIILIIDDEVLIQRTGRLILQKEYDVRGATSGEEGLSFAKNTKPDLILLDIRMIGMDGFEVIKKLHADPDTDDIPVIFLTAEESEDTEVRCFKEGAWDFVRKPFVEEVLLQRVKHTIELSHLQSDLKNEVDALARHAENLTVQTMLALSKAVDAKDHYTNGHSERVAKYSMEIARRLGKSHREQEDIYYMGILHDVGKIGVHEDIINKPGRLTDEEFAEIKSHTSTGYEILKEITELPELATGARWHHERFGGGGYPDGLSGYDIPEAARIICVADCYDAMTSNRSYSKVRPQADVRAEIERCKGSQFDPDIADIMLQMIDEDKDYRMSEQPRDDEGSSSETSADKKKSDHSEKLSLLADKYHLDIATGVKSNAGDEEEYIESLRIFCDSIEKKSEEINQYLEAKEYENYITKVHSLKSMSHIVGALELSAFARELEEAGKAGDTFKLISDTPKLMEKYAAYTPLKNEL